MVCVPLLFYGDVHVQARPVGQVTTVSQAEFPSAARVRARASRAVPWPASCVLVAAIACGVGRSAPGGTASRLQELEVRIILFLNEEGEADLVAPGSAAQSCRRGRPSVHGREDPFDAPAGAYTRAVIREPGSIKNSISTKIFPIPGRKIPVPSHRARQAVQSQAARWRHERRSSSWSAVAQVGTVLLCAVSVLELRWYWLAPSAACPLRVHLQGCQCTYCRYMHAYVICCDV